MSTPIVPSRLVNRHAESTFQVVSRSDYTNNPVKVTFGQIAFYSTNFAMLFFIGANIFASYMMSSMPNNTKQKYIYYGVVLYLTQIIYTYLDINSQKNIDKLESFTTQ